MYAHSVTIGPEFFKKAFQDYSDKFWAFAREIMQNSIDCGSRSIMVEVHKDPEGNHTRVAVTNNGAPMTREILTDKLLALGSSGKDFSDGNVGGFGKAKEILYFAHTAYNIHSGRWTVAGSGAGYDLIENTSEFVGTISDVLWEHDVSDRLVASFDKFARLMPEGSPVEILINGQRVRAEIDAGTFNRVLDHEGERWADVSLSEARTGSYLVRIGGIPMFTGRCEYKGLVILDLQGTSASKMTSNRDSLKYPYSSQLSDFVTTIAIDRSTCFKLEQATYKRFAGRKFRVATGDEASVLAPSETPRVAARTDAQVGNGMGGAGILLQDMGREEALNSVLGHEFLLKNCVRRDIPSEFNPDLLAFSDHAHWIIRAWAGCLVELHRLHGIDHEFSVGFIHAEDTLAEYEYHRDYGRIYFINPCVVGEKKSLRRYKKASRFRIAATAAHEFVHGGLDVDYHGETFAGKLTDVMALVLEHQRRFHRHLI